MSRNYSSGSHYGGYERGGGNRRGGSGYVRDGARGDYRGGRGGGRGGYQSSYYGSPYNSYKDEFDPYSSPGPTHRHSLPSSYRDDNTSSSYNTPDSKRLSVQETESTYRPSPSNEGYRGSSRGSYSRTAPFKTGYNRRESYQRPQTPRADSLNNDSNEEANHETGYQRRGTVQPVKYHSPWVQLLSLDQKREGLDQIDADMKLKDIIKEQEDLYKEQEKLNAQYKEQKVKNMKLQFEIGTIKAIAEKDALNVELTQEKLDIISFM